MSWSPLTESNRRPSPYHGPPHGSVVAGRRRDQAEHEHRQARTSPDRPSQARFAPQSAPHFDLAAIGVDRCRPAIGGSCAQPLLNRIPAGSPAMPGGHHAAPQNQSRGAAMPPKVQHDEYVPTLTICHATMQVRPFRLPVYRTAALPTELGVATLCKPLEQGRCSATRGSVGGVL